MQTLGGSIRKPPPTWTILPGWAGQASASTPWEIRALLTAAGEAIVIESDKAQRGVANGVDGDVAKGDTCGMRVQHTIIYYPVSRGSSVVRTDVPVAVSNQDPTYHLGGH
jgi:hypothetical protein